MTIDGETKDILECMDLLGTVKNMLRDLENSPEKVTEWATRPWPIKYTVPGDGEDIEIKTAHLVIKVVRA